MRQTQSPGQKLPISQVHIMCSNHDCQEWEEGTPSSLWHLQQNSGHYIPPRTHTLRTTNKKGIQMLGNQTKTNVHYNVTRKEPRRMTPLTWANKWMGRMVVPFIEIENPGGEAWLGDRGRPEVSVSRMSLRPEGYPTWGMSSNSLWPSLSVTFHGY